MNGSGDSELPNYSKNSIKSKCEILSLASFCQSTAEYIKHSEVYVRGWVCHIVINFNTICTVVLLDELSTQSYYVVPPDLTVESCSIGVAFGRSSFTDLDFADDVSLLAELLELNCSHIGDNCKWGSIPRVWGELAEDKGPRFGLQGAYAIKHQGSGPGRHGSREVSLPWLSYPLVNQKHLWHQLPKCHHSCCHAELRKSDLEVTARHLNEVEAVQHVYLTNIPVWFGLMGDI